MIGEEVHALGGGLCTFVYRSLDKHESNLGVRPNLCVRPLEAVG